MDVPSADERPMFFAVIVADAARPRVERLADTLREKGLAVIFDLESRSLKSQLKQAARVRAKYALIVGDEELAGDVVTVRNLDSSSQLKVSFDALAADPRKLG
jgi:histidyl-tRNA synthetase